MKKKTKQPGPTHAWRPNPDDIKIMQELGDKLGLKIPSLLRLGLRKLAEAEGLRS